MFSNSLKAVRDPDRNSSPSSLANLPLELFLAIIAYLKAPEICSLRLANKAMYELTFHEFGEKVISNITTDLSRDSLNRINALSRDSRMSRYVRAITIESADSDSFGSGYEWQRVRSRYIDSRQEPVQLLQDAIVRFKNCQSFHMYKHGEPEYLGLPHNTTLGPDDTVTIILGIIARIRRQLRNLSFVFRVPYLESRNRMDMIRVDRALVKTPALLAACSSLEALSFISNIVKLRDLEFPMQLIEHASALRRLTIDIDVEQVRDMPVVGPRLCSATIHGPLQELDLKNMNMEPGHNFNAFLKSFQESLTRIRLENIEIGAGEWASVFRALSEFPHLADISIRGLVQGAGSTTLESGAELITDRQKVYFPTIKWDPIVDAKLGTRLQYTFEKPPAFRSRFRAHTRKVDGVLYSGPGMELALQKMMADGVSLVLNDRDPIRYVHA